MSNVSYIITVNRQRPIGVDRALAVASACYVYNGNFYLPSSCPSHAPRLHACCCKHAHDTTSAARSMQMTCLPMRDEVSHVFPLRRPGFDDAIAIAADEEGAVGTPRCRQHKATAHFQ